MISLPWRPKRIRSAAIDAIWVRRKSGRSVGNLFQGHATELPVSKTSLLLSAMNRFMREPVSNHFIFIAELVHMHGEKGMPDDQDISPLPSSNTSPQTVPEQPPNYEQLDGLFGKVYRKNLDVMSLAFALSTNRMHQQILWHLARSGPLTAKRLHELTKISKGNISKIVSELFTANIIEKSNGPSGSEPLHIRKELRASFLEHTEHVKRLLQAAFGALNHDEQQHLHSMLTRVHDKLDSIHEELKTNSPMYINFEQNDTDLPTIITESGSRSNNQSHDKASRQRDSESFGSQCDYNAVKIERQIRFVVELNERIMKIST